MSVTVITGASSGMGRSCVEQLRGTADHLVTVDLVAPDIEGTRGIACDVADPTAIGSLVDQVSELGPLRGLVHAAGISPTMADPRRVIEVDLVGTALVLEAFEPMVEEGTAGVCFSSSAAYQVALAGIDPELQAFVSEPLVPGFLDDAAARFDDSGMAYSWAKRGVIAVVGHAAVRWGAKGGRVNSVAPGLIDTPMGRQEFEQQPVMALMLEKTPLGRLGRSEEAAAVVTFLLSSQASFISGIDVLVDGGGLQGFVEMMKG
jgi:NAD(P)-dependent dehydrogenase (short-subunit alcohol dehydrogenase family)